MGHDRDTRHNGDEIGPLGLPKTLQEWAILAYSDTVVRDLLHSLQMNMRHDALGTR